MLMSKLDGRAENPHTTGWYRGDKAATEAKEAETTAMKAPPRDPELDALIEQAKDHVMTDEESPSITSARIAEIAAEYSDKSQMSVEESLVAAIRQALREAGVRVE